MPHGFYFTPVKPKDFNAVFKGAYSTNGFSLVGLALCGVLGFSDWTELDQAALAWGDKSFRGDSTQFGKRGECLQYENMAHQYYSGKASGAFVDIAPSSCINSWMGGNIMMRPLDGARFAFSVGFRSEIHGPNQPLLNRTSISEMLKFHVRTNPTNTHQQIKIKKQCSCQLIFIEGLAVI